MDDWLAMAIFFCILALAFSSIHQRAERKTPPRPRVGREVAHPLPDVRPQTIPTITIWTQDGALTVPLKELDNNE